MNKKKKIKANDFLDHDMFGEDTNILGMIEIKQL